MKKTFKAFVEAGEVPNLLLSGGSGVGKTTVAKAMLAELGHDCIVINGSLNGNIDTLRTEIQSFASSISFSGGRKYVILDEADNLNSQSTQPALRNFMEEFSANCGFILTCNYPAKILPALRSRCTEIKFRVLAKDTPKLAMSFFKRAQNVLQAEGVEFDPAALAEVIKVYFPDFRRVLNELQVYGKTGKIDSGILVRLADDNMKTLIGFLKDKNFKEVRKWTADNMDLEMPTIIRTLYDNAYEYVKPATIPVMIVTLSKYQYQHAFVADPEINAVAMFVELMVECEFV